MTKEIKVLHGDKNLAIGKGEHDIQQYVEHYTREMENTSLTNRSCVFLSVGYYTVNF